MSETFKIGSVEKDIPIPPVRGQTAMVRWPFEHMKIGDSFVVAPCGDNLRTAIYRAAKRRPHFALISRPVDKADPTKGIRFWRVEAKDAEPEPASTNKSGTAPSDE